MSVNPANGHYLRRDHTDISGEEAWARRCSLPSLAPWIPQDVKTEGNVLQGPSSTYFPSTLYGADQGEISEMQRHNHQPQKSEANSFLYSIPQWQPPSTKATCQQPSKRPSQPVPPRPPSARFPGRPPPSLASIQLNNPSSTQPQDQNPSALLRDVGYEEKIPGIYRKDVLDKRIGIRPRLKRSTELQELINRRHAWSANGANLPRSMQVIIQQFMVANGYVFPHKNMTPVEFSKFQDSLIRRLDLERTSLVTEQTRNFINSRWGSIDAFVAEQSRDWRARGIFKQVPDTARPTFAAFTGAWTDRTWDGSTRDFACTTVLTTRPPLLPLSPNEPSRPMDSKIFREATRQVASSDDDTRGLADSVYGGLKPILKRSCQDGPNNQANKRARTRDYAPIMSEHEYVDHVYDEANELELTRPEEKGLPEVIEAIRHARATLLDLAPMTAKDLANLQRDWGSNGFTDTLAETLTIGRSHTVTMGEYFDNALELLSLLKTSDHWNTDHMKVQVDCACQKGDAAPEQLQNKRMPDPSISVNGNVKVQHSHEPENAIPDRSQDGRVADRRIPLVADIKVDCSSHPQGVASDQLQIEIESVPPIAVTEKAQFNGLPQPTAAQPDPVGNGEVSDPQEVPNGSAENPWTL